MSQKNNFKNSQEFLNRALKVIPLGSQTFSKSITQYPKDCSPLFIEKAKGAFAFDIDGNRYLDVVNALASITLGYQNSKVDAGVKKQIRKGSIFSLPGKLETVVAEKISQLVPSLEMMRFAKNGSDATAAAVRLARAYTKRDHVIISGYHGWQDWYIGTTSRNLGVPKSVAQLSHKATFNEISSFETIFESYSNQIAAVIIEPIGSELPERNFLKLLRELCDTQGAVLIFDETISGFRVSEGGAQAIFDVKPDLSTFGKGIANGYPLSVVGGNREIMKYMEDIFFSGTFGGDLIALAAANVVLDLHLKGEVCPELNSIGESIKKGIDSLLVSKGLDRLLSLSGHPSWLFWNWRLSEENLSIAKSVFLQNNIANGILMLGTINVSTALQKKERSFLLSNLNKTLDVIQEAHNENNFAKHLIGRLV
jgi:glutamate-1-semialdehyde 2,1-aminomutase